MRALFPMYDTPFQFAAPKRLNLGLLSGFAGKRIGNGRKARTAGTYFPEAPSALYNFAIIHRDVPDDLAYRIVKAVFEHPQEMVSIHPLAKETVPANLDRDTFLPLHPGAALYYREIGVGIPAQLVPVEN